MRGTSIQEEHLEFVLSLDLVKHFSKLSSIRALKPITSALEQGDAQCYKDHWGDLLRYETFCKLTSGTSELAPIYLPPLEFPRVESEDKKPSKHCVKLTMKYDSSQRVLTLPYTLEVSPKLFDPTSIARRLHTALAVSGEKQRPLFVESERAPTQEISGGTPSAQRVHQAQLQQGGSVLPGRRSISSEIG